MSLEEDQVRRERNLRPVESVAMRKPKVTNNQPDWIQRAAEKRKRASLLIEQGAWLEPRLG